MRLNLQPDIFTGTDKKRGLLFVRLSIRWIMVTKWHHLTSSDFVVCFHLVCVVMRSELTRVNSTHTHTHTNQYRFEEEQKKKRKKRKKKKKKKKKILRKKKKETGDGIMNWRKKGGKKERRRAQRKRRRKEKGKECRGENLEREMWRRESRKKN